MAYAAANPNATYVAAAPMSGQGPAAPYEQLLPDDRWKRVRFSEPEANADVGGLAAGGYAMGGGGAGYGEPRLGNGCSSARVGWSGAADRRRGDWRQIFYVGLCIAAILLLILGASSMHLFGSPSALDCQADFGHAAVAWSDTKKEFCCENVQIGCELLPEHGKHPKWHGEKPPAWLEKWLGDFSLGVKIILTACIFVLVGCCSGVCCYLQIVKASVAKDRAQTEHELMRELTRTLHLVGAKSGEITVTLMWDTKDDLDLHVKLPGGYGEISVENQECSGGAFNIDGNVVLASGKTKPVEHIYWPKCSRSSNTHPPIGEYEVWVNVFDKIDLCAEANVTVMVNIRESKEIYYVRVLPGCAQLKVATFQYDGPTGQAGEP